MHIPLLLFEFKEHYYTHTPSSTKNGFIQILQDTPLLHFKQLLIL